jgi:hypothetical protein
VTMLLLGIILGIGVVVPGVKLFLLRIYLRWHGYRTKHMIELQRENRLRRVGWRRLVLREMRERKRGQRLTE